MRGRDIAAFQQLLNERFAAWNIDKRIDVDGEYGPMTRRAARQAVYALGISGTELAHGVTPELRIKLRRPSRRTPDEVAHAARRRGWLGRLRRQHEGRGAQAALAYARKHLGVVESPPSTNRGPLIDRWNRATGTVAGQPVVRQLRQRLPDGRRLPARAVAEAVLGDRGQRQGRQGRLAVDDVAAPGRPRPLHRGRRGQPRRHRRGRRPGRAS